MANLRGGGFLALLATVMIAVVPALRSSYSVAGSPTGTDASARGPNAWSPTGLMIIPRHTHTAQQAAMWRPTAAMSIGRAGHTATLLSNGKVLVVGGEYCPTNGKTPCVSLSSAELYDPRTGQWATTGHMHDARGGHVATLLSNGMVLVAGGEYCDSNPDHACTTLDTAELYDPAKGTWTMTGHLPEGYEPGVAILLPTGEVFTKGGPSRSATTVEYDVHSGKWTTVGPLLQVGGDTAILLRTGKVLDVGGSLIYPRSAADARLFDPKTATWAATGSMLTSRASPTATLLPDGKVLIAGGVPCSETPSTSGQCEPLASAELYDPRTGRWAATGHMIHGLAYNTATLLADGRVLVAGGEHCTNRCFSADTEVYDPHTGPWAAIGRMGTVRIEHTATLLSNGMVLVAGGRNAVLNPRSDFNVLSSAELYTSARVKP